MTKIKFAVIGCGNIGKRHIAVINEEPRASIVALCDTDEKKCNELRSDYPNIHVIKDFADLIKNSDAEVISICTPHGLHAPMAIEAARAKKHILVEKPMALTVEDANKMIRAAEENNVKLMVVKQNRYNIPIAITKKALEARKLGKIFMVQCNVMWNRNPEYYSESNWRGIKELEGSALHTQVSHFIDLMIWWFGDVIEAKTKIETKNQKIQIEDCGLSLLTFSSGVIGSLFWTTCVYNKNYEGSITIIGEKGTIKIGGLYLNKIDYWDVQSYPLPEDTHFIDKPNNYGKYQGTSSNHDMVIRDVIASLLNERYSVVEGDEGLKTIKAIEIILNN